MCIGLAYIILVPSRILIRKQPMRILLQSHDKPIYIYMDRPLNRGALNLKYCLSVHTCKYIRGSRINVGFIIYEELSLLNTAVTLIQDLSTIPESIAWCQEYVDASSTE